MQSLLTASTIADMGVDADAEPDQYLTIAFRLAFLVGLVQIVMGLLHAGYLVNFLSQPVLKGFTVAAALIIGSSQLSQVFGLRDFPSTSQVYETWYEVAIRLGDTHGLTLALAVESLAMFYGLKWLKAFLRSLPCVENDRSHTWSKIISAVPDALVVVVFNTALSAGLGFED